MNYTRTSFQHNIADGDLKDLPNRTVAEVLRDKVFNISKYAKYDG